MEQLEGRLTPTAFTWIGGGADSWETPADWAGGNGTTNYPGWDGSQITTNDTVTFNNTAQTFDCITHNSHTVSTFTMSGWAGHLTLGAPLTKLGNGGSMDNNGEEILNPGQNATLTFAIGTFTWSGSYINWDPNQPPQIGNVTITSGAEVDITGTAIGQGLGDNLTNNGLLKRANTNTTVLYNRPTITNNGTIQVTKNSGSLLRASGDAVVTVQNAGTIQVTANNYTIGEAINMSSTTAKLQIQSGWLIISAADPSAGYSLLEPQGTVEITGGTAGAPELIAKYGVQQTGGITKTAAGSTGTAYLETDFKDYVMTGGAIQVGDNTPSTPKLEIEAGPGGTGGNFQFTSGSVQLYYDTNGAKSSLLQVDGTTGITVGQTGTTVAVTFVGNGNQPQSFDVMTAPTQGASISRIAASNPTGYTASITNNKHNYTLTKTGSSPLGSLADLATVDSTATTTALPPSGRVQLSGAENLTTQAFAGAAGSQNPPAVGNHIAPWWLGAADLPSVASKWDDWFVVVSLFGPDHS